MKRTLSLLVGIIAFASCSDHESLFDSERVQEEAKENFPVQNVDPNHTWQMMAVRTLDVFVNEKEGETYTIKVFTDNPFKTYNDAHLLAVTQVKNGVTASLTFDAPLIMEYVYVMRQVGEKDCVVTVATLENNKFVARFGDSVAPRSASARATGVTITPPSESEYICPQNAKPVSENDLKSKLTKGDYCIEGEVKTSKLEFHDGVRLYVKRGAKLILTDDINLNAGTLIVCEGGIVERPQAHSGKLNLHLSGGSIYNKGQILLYLDNAGLIQINNNKSRFINEGTLAVNGAGIAISGGEFYTGDKSTTQTISTVINHGKWVNDGYYMSQEEFKIQAQAEVQNNCRLYAGSFVFDSGNAGLNNAGYVTCEEASLTKGTLNAAFGSIFEVLETATIEGFTIKCEQSEPSMQAPLLWINNATSSKNEHNNGISIDRAINISCKNDFFDKMNVTLVNATVNGGGTEEQSCAPGYDIDKPDGGEPTAAEYTYVFEDITTKAGDYDFNDVVLYVSNPINNEVTVTLVATGANNKLWLKYDFGSSKGELFGGKEVHAAFGQSETILINTDGKMSFPVVEYIIENVPDGFSLTEHGDIYIVDEHGLEVHPFKEQNGITFALRIPDKWDYPTERISIDKKYPEFGEWGANYKNAQDWYLHPAH